MAISPLPRSSRPRSRASAAAGSPSLSTARNRAPVLALVGAVPGARPPVTGWVAAREDLGVGAWVLFGILFLWQLPHTLAIARLYRDDYARAGVRLLPVVDAEGSSTERQIVTGCLALLVVSLLPTLIGIADPATTARQTLRVLLMIIAALVVASFLVGIRW